MPELDMVSIVLLEIGMIIGGIVGFLVVITAAVKKNRHNSTAGVSARRGRR